MENKFNLVRNEINELPNNIEAEQSVNHADGLRDESADMISELSQMFEDELFGELESPEEAARSAVFAVLLRLERFRMVPNGSDWFRMFPNGSEWFRTVPDALSF